MRLIHWARRTGSEYPVGMDLGRHRGGIPHPAFVTLVAVALSLAIVAVVVGPRVIADQQVPQEDLRAALLSDVPQLVTPLQVGAEDHGVTVGLIGAYADPARTVLFFRVSPDAGSPMVRLSDDQGVINSSESLVSGAPEDHVVAINAGPRAAADGLAHLTVQVGSLQAFGQLPDFVNGNWTLNFVVPIQPSSSLTAPTGFQLANWKVTIEVLEVTPAVIHLQAVLDGAGVDEVGDSIIGLFDKSGRQVRFVAFGGESTVPKSELKATGPPTNSRLNVQWLRPRSAGKYDLRFRKNDATYTIALAVPAP